MARALVGERPLPGRVDNALVGCALALAGFQ